MSHIAGHQYIHLSPDTVGIVPDAGKFRTFTLLHPPVGNDHTVEAPFLPQDRGDQIIVIVRPAKPVFPVSSKDAMVLSSKQRVTVSDSLETSRFVLP